MYSYFPHDAFMSTLDCARVLCNNYNENLKLLSVKISVKKRESNSPCFHIIYTVLLKDDI